MGIWIASQSHIYRNVDYIKKKKWVHVPVLGKSYIFYKLTILHILSYPLTNRNKTKNWSLFSFSFLFLRFGIELDANRK